MIIDLFNRDIIALSVGWHKTADLLKEAIQSIPYALTKVNIFHSDRGKEFDNQLIDERLVAFDITRSLSQAGCPYDNAVTENTYRSFKLEFINQETFQSLEELKGLCPLVEPPSNSQRSPLSNTDNQENERLTKTLYKICTEKWCLFR